MGSHKPLHVKKAKQILEERDFFFSLPQILPFGRMNKIKSTQKGLCIQSNITAKAAINKANPASGKRLVL